MCIRDRYGGIIFYIANPPVDLDGDGSLDDGLVCATSDVARHDWGCGYNTSLATSIGDGKSNTTSILNTCPSVTTAASLCDQYSVTISGITYNDWFLPSKDELTKMNENVGPAAASPNTNIANFGANLNYDYWTSSGVSNTNAWSMYLNTLQWQNTSKNDAKNIRAVRAFKR